MGREEGMSEEQRPGLTWEVGRGGGISEEKQWDSGVEHGNDR